MDELDRKIYDSFAGRVVKKGATKLIKDHQMFLHTFLNTF